MAENEITSENIVGYMEKVSGTERSTGVGDVFMPVAGGDTFKLSDITVTSGTANKYMNPLSEYIQHLSSDKATVDGRYTYISEAYLHAAFPNAQWNDKYLAAIGWWNYVQKTNYRTKILNDDYKMKIGTLTVNPGDTFLGLFGGANNLVINFPAATDSAVK